MGMCKYELCNKNINIVALLAMLHLECICEKNISMTICIIWLISEGRYWVLGGWHPCYPPIAWGSDWQFQSGS